MFDWLESIEDYFNQLGEAVNELVYGIQDLVESIDAYITFSTYYIYISGIVLAILFVMGIAILNRQSYIVKQNEQIIQMIEDRNLRGGIGNGKNDQRSDGSDNSSS